MANEPETRLDRIARDLSRTWLHGSRVTDNAGQTRPATVASAQQIQVDLPANGPMNFEFMSAASTTNVLISNTDAADNQKLMLDALGKDRTKYLTLEVDKEIPNWVFSQRSYSISNSVAGEDKIEVKVSGPSAPGTTRDLTIIKLPASALAEVSEKSDSSDSFVSLYQFDRDKRLSVIPRSNWQPAIMVRLKLKQPPQTENLPADVRIFEIEGVPQGDRYYLDQIGLLDAYLSHVADPNPPEIEAISLALQTGNNGTPTQVDDWVIVRTNLTREARSGTSMIATVPPTLPYIACSGGNPDQDKDAVRLLQMISIANSGGYFLRVPTPQAGADTLTLVLTVILKAQKDTDNTDSALLPRAANGVALSHGTSPDSIRFNGLEHIQIAPITPPGNVVFGWTRTEPTTKTTYEDKFGFGTISLVDYSAIDGTGAQVGLYSQDTVIAISPSKPLHGELFELHRPAAMDGALGTHHMHTGNTAAMQLLSQHQKKPDSVASTTMVDEVVQHFRSTLTCYDEKRESPYMRIGDPLRAQISFRPGFRDVFGNRFDAASAPIVRRRLFYTDALVSPSEWPGIRFAVYPVLRGGKPYLNLEMQYRYLDLPADKKLRAEQLNARLKRLNEIRTQLKGINGDVAVTFSVKPIVNGSVLLNYAVLADKIDEWMDKENNNNSKKPNPLVETLISIPCNGLVNNIVKFEPWLTITRTKAEYGPSPTDLPNESLLANQIISQISSVSSPISLQVSSSQPITLHELAAAAATSKTDDEFREIAKAFQDKLAATMKTHIGFLRDRFNQHELWFVPDAFFPTAPDPAKYSEWSFAMARPLSNKLHSETFSIPDFNASCTTTGPDCWRKHPVVTQTVIDQDFDDLGRIAFQFLEQESSDLVVMTDRANAHTARTLLAEREQIALNLSSFEGDGGPGYLVRLYEEFVDLESAGVVRIAKDALLRNLNAFYDVDTIIQLPLVTVGSDKILTFEGKVESIFETSSSKPRPVVSDILLGGGDRKVTLLYDLPSGTKGSSDVQRLTELNAKLHHVQLPLEDEPSGRNNLFNQGRWIELVNPWELKWTAPPDFIPVADRRFPSKPVIRSTETLTPWMDPHIKEVTPPLITALNTSLLVRWGWKFQFSFIEPGPNDVVHVTARYNERPTPVSGVSKLATATGWKPQSLLNALIAVKLLQDNRLKIAAPDRLQVTADLAAFLRENLSAPMAFTALAAAQPEDHFIIPARKPSDPPITFPSEDNNSGGRSIMLGRLAQDGIRVTWETALGPQTATVIAPADVTNNNAFLTGINPVRNYRIALRLLRNETFESHRANSSLIYECAPVESPLECWAQNMWPQLKFDNGGQSLQAALVSFFEGLLLHADLSSMNLEVGVSLVWKNGMLRGETPFSILPTDIKPASGMAKDVADFVFGKYQALIGTAVPVDVSPTLRLRVKLATLDPVPASRTLLDITAIDFPA